MHPSIVVTQAGEVIMKNVQFNLHNEAIQIASEHISLALAWQLSVRRIIVYSTGKFYNRGHFFGIVSK